MTVQDDVTNLQRRQLFQDLFPKLPSFAPIIPHNVTAVTPSIGFIALNKMAFGPKPGVFDIDTFNSFGANDTDRLNGFIDWQLDGATGVGTDFTNRYNAAAFVTINKTRPQLWQEHLDADGVDWTWRTLALREIERLMFMRAIYSQRQLDEVLADFWHNHFNVQGWSMSQVSGMFAYYDREVIRANMYGNFREMLETVAKSTEMLYYLDNYTNSRSGPNENFARELFELHTMGAENYLGVMQQGDVPDDGNGFPVGYVDADVYEATRCFTGWTVANSSSSPGGDTGEFLYRDDWHDRFQKTVLGHFIPADQAIMKDGHDVLDFLAEHPGTARYVCRKLCRRFIADDPPDSIVNSAAAIFHAQWQAPDQLKQVTEHILRSTEFQTTWGEKVKRPFEVVASAMRATHGSYAFDMNESDTGSFMWYYDMMGQPPFNWPPPNGYPDTKEAWQSTTPMLFRWRMVNWLVDDRDTNDNYHLDILGQTPAPVRSATALADFWIDRIYGYAIPASERQIIIDFMRQEEDANTDLDFSDGNVQSRVRSMVALIINSPQFQLR